MHLGPLNLLLVFYIMIDKKSIIKMAEHVFRRSQGYPDRRLMHPKREWGIGILIFTLLVFIGSLLAGKMFVQYKDFTEVVGVTEQSVPKYRDVIVQDALDLYQQKEVQFDVLQGEYVAPVPLEAIVSPDGQEQESTTIPDQGNVPESLVSE